MSLVCAGAAAALWWRGPVYPTPPELVTGTLLAPRRAIADFTLIDHQGRKFANADLLGHWSLLDFGYTNCPDVCPTTLATLAAFSKRLLAAGSPPPPRVIFVSVDAARDTPAQLQRYVPYFDPTFLGVTAPTQAIAAGFARDLGLAVILTPPPDGSYSVDHSSALLVVDPAGRLAAILAGPFTAAGLQADYGRIVAGST